MRLSDGKHPLWALIRMAMLMSFALIFLSMTATSFDSGELKTVGGVGLASVVFDYIKKQLVV